MTVPTYVPAKTVVAMVSYQPFVLSGISNLSNTSFSSFGSLGMASPSTVC